MKISRSIESKIRLGKGEIRIGDDGREEHSGRVELNSKKNEVNANKFDDDEIENNEVGKNHQKTSKFKKLF